MSFVEAFAVTLAVEVPLYLGGIVVLRLARPTRALIAGLLANVVTHPVLWWALLSIDDACVVVAAELVVWVVEAVLVRVVTRCPTGMAALLALGANAASFGVGLVLSGSGG